MMFGILLTITCLILSLYIVQQLISFHPSRNGESLHCFPKQLLHTGADGISTKDATVRKCTRLDLTGQTFGRLTVIAIGDMTPYKDSVWICKCSCGKMTRTAQASLRSGRVRSCGCGRYVKHGHSNQRESGGLRVGSITYVAWTTMKARVLNPHNPSYSRYGGRGITICDSWLHSFEAFLKDMGERPSQKYSLDRIDNSKGYSPSNCKWSTMKEQCRNRRDNKLITFNGKTQPLIAWAEELGWDQRTILSRLRTGWTLEAAMTTPPRPRRELGRARRKPKDATGQATGEAIANGTGIAPLRGTFG